jgi:putative peptidoglycan lipid II flippase
MERARKPYATAKSATVLAALSVLSPLAGLAVEIALAWRFGTSTTVDAFRIVALLLVFGQQLFVTNILPHAVIPVFGEYRALGRLKEAWQITFSLVTLLLILTLLISILGFTWPHPVVNLLGPGLAGEAKGTAILLVRWFAVTYIPLMWSGMAAGMLYAHGIFWLPAAAQVVNNLTLIVLILGFGRVLGPASLAIGALLGSVGASALYAVRLARLMRQEGVQFSFHLDVGHPGVQKASRLAIQLLGGIIASQWAAVVTGRVLSELPTGALAAFGYAWKMGQIVSLLPGVLATVLFPRFVASWQSSTDEEFRNVCTTGLWPF